MMKVIVTGRGGGKTQAMLDWMREAPEGEHRVCVAHSKEEAMRLLRENRDLESWQFVGPGEVTREAWSGVLRGRGGRIVLGIDNADMLLGQLLHWPVGAASFTDEMADQMARSEPSHDPDPPAEDPDRA